MNIYNVLYQVGKKDFNEIVSIMFSTSKDLHNLNNISQLKNFLAKRHNDLRPFNDIEIFAITKKQLQEDELF
jgi:hypothetical protein